MKITCIADTHDKQHEIILGEGDILIHAGDATMNGTRNQLVNFVLWFAKQPFKHKVWVAGNHDWGMEFDQTAYEAWCGRRGRQVKELTETRNLIRELCAEHGIIYLNNNGVEVEGIKIWGSPDQPAFCGWAFNRSNKELEDIWKYIPDDTDILITHAPAYGILDQLENGDHVGDEPLAKRLEQLPNLKLHVCGHIHCSNGSFKIGNTTHVNAAILNEMYRVQYKPIKVEL